jgi:acetyl esterase/lipase
MIRRRTLLASLLTGISCLTLQAHAQEGEPTRVSDVIYAKHDGVALTMDVFKPAKPNGIGVIAVVSGGWVSNHNNINPELAKAFTRRGMTVFQVVHGTQPRFVISEIVQDIHRAVRFIRSHAADYSVDPNRLGITGGSAGGHLSLMIGAQAGIGKLNLQDSVDSAASAVQAVAVFFPPTDFMNYGKEGAKAIDFPLLRGFWPAFGVTDATPKAKLEEIGKSLSPVYAMTEKMPPTLIIHGDKDTLVPIQQAQVAMSKLESLKVPHELITAEGKGHGWPDMNKDVEKLADWFEKYLVKK